MKRFRTRGIRSIAIPPGEDFVCTTTRHLAHLVGVQRIGPPDLAAPQDPVIRIRAPAANSLSMAPPMAGLTGPGAVPESGTTLAAMKPICYAAACFGSGRNSCLHRSSKEREIPYRRAVAVTPAQLGYLLEGIDWRMPQHTWRPQAAG